jgi:hypothetical protein
MKRVNPMVRERARERMMALPEEERRERARKMREGREAKAARRPERLQEVEERIDRLGEELAEADTFERRWPLRVELRDLGRERMRLMWGDS